MKIEQPPGQETTFRIDVWRDGGCRAVTVFLGEERHTCLAEHRDNTGAIHMYELIDACSKAIIGYYERQDPSA